MGPSFVTVRLTGSAVAVLIEAKSKVMALDGISRRSPSSRFPISSSKEYLLSISLSTFCKTMFSRSPRILRNFPTLVKNCRLIRTSAVVNIKQINVKEEGNRITIDAEYKTSPREKYLIPDAKPISSNNLSIVATGKPCACPLCRLGLHIQHTDVLILRQFTDDNGKQIPKEITGLCKQQHKRIKFLLVMAEKSGLMERKADDGTQRALVGWESFNKYYDENVIEEFIYYTTRRFRA